MEEPIRLKWVTYHGGFSSVVESNIQGHLVVDSDTVSFYRTRASIEVCRSSEIVAIEVTSEQVAKSKLAAAVFFGVLGGVTAKATKDRATMIIQLENGDTGYFSVDQLPASVLLGQLTPWMRERGIKLDVEPGNRQSQPNQL